MGLFVVVAAVEACGFVRLDEQVLAMGPGEDFFFF